MALQGKRLTWPANDCVVVALSTRENLLHKEDGQDNPQKLATERGSALGQLGVTGNR
jgi:hypothetical protein